jgi:hypothetical protein
LLYWETAHWEEVNDPWVDPATYAHWGYTYNCEESLFYPGKVEEVGCDGPVASMRLKWLREGIEDYEYIEKLRLIDE